MRALSRLQCVLRGHRPPYVFYGVAHCPRCWTGLQDAPAPTTPVLTKKDDEWLLEYLIKGGWTLSQIRRCFPNLRAYLPQ